MWLSLTESDLLTVLSGPELAAYRALALAAGQSDPVAPTISEVTEEIRGSIAACARNQLGPLGTIPGRLKAAALDLLAVRLPARLGRNPRPVRRDAALRAAALLQAVAAGQFQIDQPDTASPEVESTPLPSFTVPRPLRCHQPVSRLDGR